MKLKEAMENKIKLLTSELDDVHFEYVLLPDFIRGICPNPPYHDHDLYEMHLVTQGSFRIFIEGAEYRLDTGELMLIPPKKKHLIYPEKDTVRTGFRFRFSRIPGADGTIYRYLCGSFDAAANCCIWKKDTVCCSYILNVLNCFRDGSSDFLVSQLLQTALLYAADERVPLPDTDSRYSALDRDNVRIVQMEEFLNANYQRRIMLNEVAEMYHLSEIQTERTILRLFGKTLTTLVKEKRLATACFLLHKTALPLDSIADKCGYGSTSYFCRCFRGAMNMTPLDYRTAASQERGNDRSD